MLSSEKEPNTRVSTPHFTRACDLQGFPPGSVRDYLGVLGHAGLAFGFKPMGVLTSQAKPDHPDHLTS